MDPIGFGAVASGGADLISTGLGIFNSNRNYKLQKKQFEYQKQLQREIFKREDNAVQRRAADLRAANINPLLAAGGAASTGQAVQTTAPQYEMPDIGFGGNAAMKYAEFKLSQARQNVDISHTKAQQELINTQRRGQELQNELTQKQIDWYDKHPGYAPGVDSGVSTGKGLSSVFDNVSNRLGSMRRSMYDWFREKSTSTGKTWLYGKPERWK